MRALLFALLGVILIICGLWLMFGPGYTLVAIPHQSAIGGPVIYDFMNLQRFSPLAVTLSVVLLLMGMVFLFEADDGDYSVNWENVGIALLMVLIVFLCLVFWFYVFSFLITAVF